MVLCEIRVQCQSDQPRLGLTGDLELEKWIRQQGSILDNPNLAALQLVVKERAIRRKGEAHRKRGAWHECIADGSIRHVLWRQRTLWQWSRGWHNRRCRSGVGSRNGCGRRGAATRWLAWSDKHGDRILPDWNP